MSHIVMCANKIHFPELLQAALASLQAQGQTGLEWLGPGQHRVYMQECDGLGFRLPGWRFPVVLDPQSGTLRYDNYSGNWGAIAELDSLLQRYYFETAKQRAASSGLLVEELWQENGDVELRLTGMFE